MENFIILKSHINSNPLQVYQTAYTLHHRNLTQHDHLFMFVLGQIAVQFEKEVLPILQPVIEMFLNNISQIVHYVVNIT